MAMESGVWNVCDHSHNVTFFYNLVGKKINPKWMSRDLMVISVGLTVCVIVVLANLLVMVAIFMNRRFHYSIYYLLGNMAAADLFAGMAYAYLMLHTGPWTATLTKEQWFLRSALINISLTASVANLLAVAVERHQTIITMQLHSNMTKKRVVLLIVSIWAVAIVIGLVPSKLWNCECDLSNCSTIAPLYSRHFLIFWAVLNLFTFFVMVTVYARIFVYVRHKSQHMSQHTSEFWQSQTVVKLMKTISIVLGAFVICWTPGLMTLLLDGILGKDSNAAAYEKYCLVIAECNSLVNPIIYTLRDKEMRRTFKWILCYLCRRQCDDNEREPFPVQYNSPQLEENMFCDQKTENNICMQDHTAEPVGLI